MKTQEQRIVELEQTVAQLTYDLALVRKLARPATPLAARRGWFLGMLRKDYTQGGAAEFMECDVYTWENETSKWKKIVVPPFGFIKARDWFLNTDEEVEKKTKLKVEYYETTWVVTGLYCSPTDLDEYKPSPGTTSVGSMEQFIGSGGESGGGLGGGFAGPAFGGDSVGNSFAIPPEE
jgi:hypothetical protein